MWLGSENSDSTKPTPYPPVTSLIMWIQPKSETWQRKKEKAWLNCLFCFINSPLLGYGFQSSEVGSNWCLSGGFGGTAHPFTPHRWPFTRPSCVRTTPSRLFKNPPHTNSKPRHTQHKLKALRLSSRKRGFEFERAKQREKFIEAMKMDHSASMASSKRRLSSNRGLGGVLREQRARLEDFVDDCNVELLDSL
ncbi:hypothetical protein CR513_27995, partial [Mucuna pruriens]